MCHLCGGGGCVTENPLVSVSGNSAQKCNREILTNQSCLAIIRDYSYPVPIKDYLINSANSCLITSENEAKFDPKLDT